MRFLDKIALNRLVSILTSFVINIIKLLKSNEAIDDITPKPPKKTPFFRRRKNLQ